MPNSLMFMPRFVPFRERAVRSLSGQEEGTTTSLYLGSVHNLHDLAGSLDSKGIGKCQHTRKFTQKGSKKPRISLTCSCRKSPSEPWQTPSWIADVAVKELKLRYSIKLSYYYKVTSSKLLLYEAALLFAMYPCYGNLMSVPEQQPSLVSACVRAEAADVTEETPAVRLSFKMIRGYGLGFRG